MGSKFLGQALADVLLLVDNDVRPGERQFPMVNVIPRARNDVSLRAQRTNLFDDTADGRWVRDGNNYCARGSDTDLFERLRFSRVTNNCVESKKPSGAYCPRIEVEDSYKEIPIGQCLTNRDSGGSEADDDDVIGGNQGRMRRRL